MLGTFALNPFMFKPTDLIAESPVLQIYKKLVEITGTMRAKAQDQQWEELIELGRQYQDTVALLRAQPAQDALTAPEQEARMQLLHQILENDAATRDLAQPELGRVGALLNQIMQQKTMLRAYGRIAPDQIQ